MPKVISYQIDYKCPCGKDYYGESKKIEKLITLHSKVCSLATPIVGVEPETLEIHIDMTLPKSRGGELMRQKVANGTYNKNEVLNTSQNILYKL